MDRELTFCTTGVASSSSSSEESSLDSLDSAFTGAYDTPAAPPGEQQQQQQSAAADSGSTAPHLLLRLLLHCGLLGLDLSLYRLCSSLRLCHFAVWTAVFELVTLDKG